MKIPSTPMIRERKNLLLNFFLFLFSVGFSVQQLPAAGSPNMVIAELYGAGGNAGATLYADYLVLFNRGSTNQSLAGWSVQYSSAAGSGTWGVSALPNVIVPPGGYFLVQVSAVGGNGTSFVADSTNILNMAASAGKAAVVSSTVALTGTNPASSTVVDLVGFGATANGYEGTGPAPAPGTTTALRRAGAGCTDSDNNAADFSTFSLTSGYQPNRSATAESPCGGSSLPSIISPPQSKTVYAGEQVSFSVTASGSPAPAYLWFMDDVLLSDNGQINGATTSVLTISNVTPAQAGNYVVIATNSVGAATSAPPATLNVLNDPPTFIVQPQNRTTLPGTEAKFTARVVGALPLVYQWQLNGTNLTDGGQFSGSTTPTLTISQVMETNAGDYQLVVTNGAGPNGSSTANLNVVTSGPLAGWDFNGALNATNPATSEGSSAAIAAGVNVNTFSNSIASGGDFGDLNNAWGTTGYPAASVSNKTAGVQFKVSTAGLKNIMVNFDHHATATASRYSRLQYTTNGTDYQDFPFSADINPHNNSPNPLYHLKAFDLTGFPGVRNNPDFGIRIVTEFENTARYGATNHAQYAGNTSGYAPSGTVSYDLVTISAQVADTNVPPTISSVPNVTITDTTSSNLTFNINDVESSASSLALIVKSGNPSVLSHPHIANNGDGTATLVLNPIPNVYGTAPIIVTVTDEGAESAATWFAVTVVPESQPPIPPNPSISNLSISGGSVIITGTNNNGTTAGTYQVLASTNIALPLSNWTVLSAGSFDPNGSFSSTNPMGTNLQQFYILQVP